MNNLIVIRNRETQYLFKRPPLAVAVYTSEQAYMKEIAKGIRGIEVFR